MAGKAAVENAVAGLTDKMVGFERCTEGGKYVCKTKLFNLTDRGGLALGDEGAVGVVDALGHGHHAVALLGVDLLHLGNELVHVPTS
mgnify:CR=1 FL=1